MKKLIEPDMWWYLKTGQWITTNGTVPKTDVFSYTFSGVEWINVKWLYEVIVYFFSQIGGPEFTSVFQSIITVAIVIALYKVYQFVTTEKKTGPWVTITLFTLFVCSYRMTGRPETISHLFSILVFLIFVTSKKSKPFLIYSWVILQIFWVNLHEAYATGIVLMAALVLGDLVQNKINKTSLFNKHLLLAFGFSILGIMVNPRGYTMLLHPLNIFGQLSDNKFTAELFSWETAFYWQQWESWAFVFTIMLVVLASIMGNMRNPITNLKSNINQFGLGYFVILILLTYLGLTSYRNIPFLILLSSPILAIGLQRLLVKNWMAQALEKGAIAASCVAWILIVSNVFYEKSESRNRYGLEVDPLYNPIGMTTVLSSIDYKQAHFSDYLTSSYPMWKIVDFESFIDLRDLDVFPKSFFEEVLSATQSFEVFEEMDSLNGFQYAFVKRSEFPTLISGLQQSPNWKMEYADPIAVLFTKKPDAEHKDIFENYKKTESSGIAKLLNNIFNPFYKQKEIAINNDLMAAYFYFSTEDFQLAIHRVNSVINDHDMKYEALCLRASIYDEMALMSGNDSLIKLEWNDLTEAKKIDRKNGKAYFQMGMALYKRGRFADAVTEFKLSLKYEDQNAEAWSYLADCQNALAQSNPQQAAKYAARWFEYMEKALELDPDNQILAYRLGVSYCERNECDKAQPILKNLNPMPFLRDADNQNLLKCKKKCGAE